MWPYPISSSWPDHLSQGVQVGKIIWAGLESLLRRSAWPGRPELGAEQRLAARAQVPPQRGQRAGQAADGMAGADAQGDGEEPVVPRGRVCLDPAMRPAGGGRALASPPGQ
jgi:hypothetical protein